jgi:hypothetical protein
MKRTTRILALLLTLVLALSLAPVTALADPPQEECREGGQHIWDVYSDSATCTESGTRIWRCRKCGIWYQEASPALGHAWNEGVLISGEGLLSPQTMHYYCWRCGETRDETVQPDGSWVLSLLRNKEESSDLVITLQPQGGILADAADASHTMTVAAEGGVEPYTYEWRGVDKGVTEYLDGNPVGYAVHSNSRRAAEEAARRRAAFYEQYLNYTREHFGVEDVEGALRGWTELQIREYGDIQMTSGADPSYTADIGDCWYYCIVRDAAGHQAQSDRAFVGNPLYILYQPVDAELKDGQVWLSCQAGGGSGNYSYTWYREDRNHKLDQTGIVALIKEPGEYFCVVRDGDQEAVSATVTVTGKPSQSEEAPTIVVQPKSYTLKPKTNNSYSVKLTCKGKLQNGNDKQLRYYWQRMGSNGWYNVQGGREMTLTLHGSSAKISGLYRCVVVNSACGRRTVSKTVRVQTKMNAAYFRFEGRALVGRIIGGVPPYRVVIVQHRPQDKQQPALKVTTLKIGANGKFSVRLIPQKWKYYRMTVMQNGVPKIVNYRAYYSVIVYDSAGQVFRSKTIRYPD